MWGGYEGWRSKASGQAGEGGAMLLARVMLRGGLEEVGKFRRGWGSKTTSQVRLGSLRL